MFAFFDIIALAIRLGTCPVESFHLKPEFDRKYYLRTNLFLFGMLVYLKNTLIEFFNFNALL